MSILVELVKVSREFNCTDSKSETHKYTPTQNITLQLHLKQTLQQNLLLLSNYPLSHGLGPAQMNYLSASNLSKNLHPFISFIYNFDFLHNHLKFKKFGIFTTSTT